jgi:gliding motility-associated-like protein
MARFYPKWAATSCFICSGLSLHAQSLIVHEFSQGVSGSKEYLEFAVQGQRTCIDSCADVRGWIFDDNNGWYGNGTASPGYYRFKQHTNWSCVPFGSLIVVYNPADLNPAVPAADPTDADNDHVYILPINSPLLEFHTGTVYSNTGYVPATDWSGIVLNNNSDVVQTIDPANLFSAWHAVSYGSLNAPVDLPTGGSQTVYYLSGYQYDFATGWAKGNVALYETPGAPNTPANAAWLQAMDSIQGPEDGWYHQHQLICATQLPFTWNGIVLNAGGDSCTVYVTASAVTGCDSNVVLDLEVLPPPIPVIIDTGGCGSVFFEGKNYTYSRLLKDTLYNSLGCDSVYRDIYIKVYGNHPELVTTDTFGCGSLVYEGVIYDRDTVLAQRFYSIHGCDSINRVVNIVVDNFDLNLSVNPEDPYKGETVRFYSHSRHSYEVLAWEPAALFVNQEALQQALLATVSATVTVYAKNEHGCTDTGTVSFTVPPSDYLVFIPNAFSPNGDGINDRFEPGFSMKRTYTSRLQLFDRWGKAVYHSTGAHIYWDGTNVDGTAANAGMYHYRIELRFADGEKRYYKGDITLIR